MNLVGKVILFSLLSSSGVLDEHSVLVAHKVGIFESFDCKKIEFSGEHEAKRETCKEKFIVSETDEVKMIIGVDFGIEYSVSFSEEIECYTETRILNHPPIKQPSGKVTTKYVRSYKAGMCNNDPREWTDAFSWTIGDEWEIVKGDYEFVILFDGLPVVKQKIKAY